MDQLPIAWIDTSAMEENTVIMNENTENWNKDILWHHDGISLLLQWDFGQFNSHFHH